MPNYDFECEDCKGLFEQYLPYEHRNDSVQCSLCHSSSTVRLISAPSVVSKGGNKESDRGSGCCSGSSCGCD